MARRLARASAVRASARPRAASARSSRRSSAASSSRRSTSTWQRESSALLSAKDGFSVVAPTSVTIPVSTTGRNASCWARLKRCTSSTSSSVPCPAARRFAASSNARLRSATPANTAESWTKCSPARSASRRAMVVLPTPGGPQRISEARLPRSSIRVIVPCGPSRWSCPTTSSSVAGRSRSARGGAGVARGWSNFAAICRRKPSAVSRGVPRPPPPRPAATPVGARQGEGSTARQFEIRRVIQRQSVAAGKCECWPSRSGLVGLHPPSPATRERPTSPSPSSRTRCERAARHSADRSQGDDLVQGQRPDPVATQSGTELTPTCDRRQTHRPRPALPLQGEVRDRVAAAHERQPFAARDPRQQLIKLGGCCVHR